MSTVQKYLIKTGATVAFASMVVFGSVSGVNAGEMPTNAKEMTASKWVPRTVSEITAQIEKQTIAQNGQEPIEYTFQWGDTLWGVSESTGIPVDKLVKVNDIDNRSLIHAGSTIYLSADSSVVSVKNNDEVVSYDVSEEEIVETETPAEVEEAAAQPAEEVVEETAPEPAEEVVETAPEPEPTEEVVEEATPEPAEEVVEEATPAPTPEPAEEVAEEPAPAPAPEPAEESQSSSQSGTTVSVEATAYSRNQPVLSNFTFDGTDLRQTSNVIAVDPSFIPLGTRVNVPGYGEFVAADTGGAIIGNRIDIHFESLNQAIQFGRQNIEIQIIE